jgi:hypothetical protein
MMSDTDELRDYVERLTSTAGDGTFLIVTVAGTEDFLQMLVCAEKLQIDFPLVTARQRALESKVRAAASGEGLLVEEVVGSNGAHFLDVYLEKDAGRVTRVCRTFLREVFGAREDAPLEFNWDGLG